MHDSQIRLPHGPIIFGCVSLFAVIGLALTARDYVLPPYAQDRFPEYSMWFFISLVALYFLRIPLQSFYRWRWARAFPIFLIIFVLLNKPLDSLIMLPSLVSLGIFTTAFFAGAVVIHWAMRGARIFTELAINADWLRVLMVVLAPVALVMLATLLTGGRSALTLGVRIHLPTILTLFIVFGTVIAVTVTERENSVDWKKHRAIAIAAILLAVGVYYLLSRGDHGGTAILGIGVFAAMWSASRKNRPWIFTTVLAAFIVVALYFGTVVLQHERLNIAWGGVEGALRYFDEAINLRTARDMARAGGLVGFYDQLYVPSSVSMNIYNDLVVAYIAGFFGLIGLLVVALSYFLLYTRLLNGILGIMVGKSQSEEPAKKPVVSISARPSMPPPFTIEPAVQTDATARNPEGIRHVLTAYAVSLIAIFLFQLLWVFMATLWGRVPFSGLDLQPISASAISVIAFVIILLGSIMFVHNVCNYEDKITVGET